MRRVALLTGTLATILTTGCSSASEPATAPTTPTAEVTSSGPATAPSTHSRAATATTLRFTAGTTTVDVAVGSDSPAIREFLGMLPLTIGFEEFAGREKIGYLPRKLDTSDSPGSDPEDGDLIYFAPWGNLGFYYNASGIGFDDNVIHIGRYTATEEQLRGLQDQDVTITIVE
ncbi:cyclophilin-like fold protein [Micromonospora echinospora]|uniref:cyclophilin-like fold protein n=1 Tax=Micromonospora echinospora TaxID=1877 RepID=UPI0033F90A86